MELDLQIGEIDLNNIGEWPILAKIGIVVALIAAVIGGVYYVDTQTQLQELSASTAKEKTLRQQFITKQQKAANLEAYTQQFAEMEESFGSMLKQLPDKTEVASLLIEVSQTGLATGLEFELFRPRGEAPKDFYAELPIDIKVVGNFHEFGNFVSGLAALPRIVTIHDVLITPRGGGAATGDTLTLTATAKTYRYLENKR